jgi:NAD(P)-dependent dehydrogenase (short-subunit alcohol dehydrogenase family)
VGDGPLHEISMEGWSKTLEMNLTSLMLSNQAAVRQFLASGRGGAILNIASILALSPSPHYFATHAYAAAKAGVIGFSRSIASYYAKNNIRVNVIVPSLVETPMSQRAVKDQGIQSFIKSKQPLDGGRMGQPSDLDGLAVYFMSEQSKFTTSQVIAVDGGWSISEGQI